VLRDPIRALVGAAAAVIFVAAFLPWVTGSLGYRPHFDVSGFEGAGDGAITMFIALGIAAWAWRGGAAARGTLVALAPVVLGIVTLLITRVALQNAGILIASYEKQGGTGYVTWGLWLTGLGAILLSLGGGLHAWRTRRSLSFRVSISRPDLWATIGLAVGGVAGVIVSRPIIELLVVTERAAVSASLQILAAIVLGFAGAGLGARLGRWLAT
jgi:hypothetical protein